MEKENRSFSPLFFLKTLSSRFFEDDVPGLSAQLAYYLLLSLFPFLILSITMLVTWVSQDQLVGLIEGYVPAQSLTIIRDNIPDGSHGNGLISFGVIATLWPASSSMIAMMRAMNRAYDVEEHRHFLKARVIALALTFAMIFMLVVAILLPVFGHAIGHLAFSEIGYSTAFETIWNYIRWVFSTLVIFLVILIIYYIAPNKRLYFREVWKGAIVATITWQFVSLGFSYYVNNFSNYTATYGSIGGIIILLLWFFLSGMILIIGGEVNATLALMRKR